MISRSPVSKAADLSSCSHFHTNSLQGISTVCQPWGAPWRSFSCWPWPQVGPLALEVLACLP